MNIPADGQTFADSNRTPATICPYGLEQRSRLYRIFGTQPAILRVQLDRGQQPRTTMRAFCTEHLGDVADGEPRASM